MMGQDPSVDLIVALTRKNGRGLWIPNVETQGLGRIRSGVSHEGLDR